MANLTTYGCFGDGDMCKLNRASDLSKVQQWVKLGDYMELLNTSTNSAMRQWPTYEQFRDWWRDRKEPHDLPEYYHFFTGNWPQ